MINDNSRPITLRNDNVFVRFVEELRGLGTSLGKKVRHRTSRVCIHL